MNNNKKMITRILLVFYYKWLGKKCKKIDLYELKSLARHSVIRVIIKVQGYGIESSCCTHWEEGKVCVRLWLKNRNRPLVRPRSRLHEHISYICRRQNME